MLGGCYLEMTSDGTIIEICNAGVLLLIYTQSMIQLPV